MTAPKRAEGRAKRNAFDSKLTMSGTAGVVDDPAEASTVQSTPSKPAFDSQPQRESMFSGRKDRNGIPLLRSALRSVERVR